MKDVLHAALQIRYDDDGDYDDVSVAVVVDADGAGNDCGNVIQYRYPLGRYCCRCQNCCRFLDVSSCCLDGAVDEGEPCFAPITIEFS